MWNLSEGFLSDRVFGVDILDFNDFRSGLPERSLRSALLDYRNSVQIFNLFGDAISEPSCRWTLRRVLSVGIPEFAAYFCMKEIGDPGSSQGRAQQFWRSLDDIERAYMVGQFEEKFLNSDRALLSSVRHIDRIVGYMNREISHIRLPDDDSASLDVSSAEHLSNCTDAAESIGAILEALQIPNRTKRRVEQVL